MGIGLFTDAYFLSIPLKGRFQALPFHIPQSVFRESGISLRTTVPTGTHHRDNGKQAAISRQVKRKSFILDNWDWADTWGWDFPLIAMTAIRLNEPEWALETLLKSVQKNTYLPNGHNFQEQSIERFYLRFRLVPQG